MQFDRNREQRKKAFQKAIAPLLVFFGVLVVWSFVAGLPKTLEQPAYVPPPPAPDAQKPTARLQDQLGVTQTLTVTDVWSKPIMLPNNRCFRWWGEDPDNDDKVIHAQARSTGTSKWYAWKEYARLREEKKVGHPGWMRFAAVDKPAIVYYTFYDLESVKCTPK